MFPLRDSTPSHSVPVVNYLVIALNVLVFLYEASLSPNQLNRFIDAVGLVPARFIEHLGPDQIFTIFSSMFMHGGWMHLISNMWALFIFGDNIEDRMGHIRYLIFYLICGIAAGITQVIVGGVHSMVPMVGASGAIAGVLGGYLLLYPHARVTTLLFLGYFSRITELPALIYLGFWFLSQFFTGMFALSRTAEQAAEGGVAFWAHIGGFVAGFILIKLFANREEGRTAAMNYDDMYS